MTTPIRILIADDQAIVRDGLETVLNLVPDLTVVATAADGAEAVQLIAALQPDVALMDLRMPVLDGVAATRRVAQGGTGTAVLVLTTFADDADIVSALRAGAQGYLTKDAGRAELAAAIRAVAAGQSTFSTPVREALLGRIAAPDDADPEVGGPPDPRVVTADALAARFPMLTPREREVFALIVQGCSNAEIADRLFVGVSTVKTHINALFAKIGARDRAHAIARALGTAS
ncbi:response regulator transcription factor [uncultured Microbacterium sp.]|uniref:response regulator transcription factor n=1 Tax=uncultured Microbacterium sp. TaxID=191216 RepID=UPI0025F8ED4E|nr:response regulator transcription factor [uncultured Microbacterium sp.]